MTNFKSEDFRGRYWKSLETDKAFAVERPVCYGPAIAAQERQSSPFLMFKFISEWIPYQYTDFFEESQSFHDSAYLGDWSPLPKLKISGPDALDFLQYHTVNNLRSFRDMQIKHAIQLNEDGKVAGEGILYKTAEDEFRYMGGAVYWLQHWFDREPRDARCEIYSPDEFVFVVQGPKSIHVVEAAIDSGLRDLKFNYWTACRIGMHDVRILRTGITGELGYEVHGPVEAANDVWLALTEAGQAFGLRLLGGRSMIVSHVEGCFPTIGREFLPATSPSVGHSRAHSIDIRGGSLEWHDPSELFRSPFDLNWDREVSLDSHDFMGKEALQCEVAAGGPARRLVGLVWNPDDVVAVYASLFHEGPRPAFMELPRVSHKHAMDPDAVLLNGKCIGVSTSRVYSSALRKMISLCHIDRDLMTPGTEVAVVWGDKGKDQVHIRATVTDLPFKRDNRRTDVSLLPDFLSSKRSDGPGLT
ncbi:glycine cleavage T C-terminal barrel domain-containing protein [Sphingopyxis sp.]|uniref:glycine cleavage T C-terminal barrel domain-containing protein n=1 Tax=Sphingopyxis sp. TaxID=1908224 RepID=UPI002D784C80|nr:glycine cleavage T C-terminal barrel domain-containing protein [Sphingopyxis sp.]HET6522871.1 glycine cleavage T C-terminal barrel domain-containing protein [Sphingopyxis sp.]